MSEVGQTRKLAPLNGTSALPPKEDIRRRGRNDCFVPEADFAPYSTKFRDEGVQHFLSIRETSKLQRLDKRVEMLLMAIRQAVRPTENGETWMTHQ